MHVIGITGGIATGKSTVLALFAELGAPTLNADQIARELLSPGTDLTQRVIAEFPSCVLLDQALPTIDRAALAKLIFSYPAARRRLEELTHPMIIEQIEAATRIWHSQPGVIAAAEIPLLFEAGLENLVDETLVVTCSQQTQLQRLMERLNISAEDAQHVIDVQWPLERKVSLADRHLSTESSRSEIRSQVSALWADWI
jgi:dephospho-CoA kinase